MGTFDVSADVIKNLKGGKMLFAIDQQQYLQGYLPVVFAVLFVNNLNTVGGGKPGAHRAGHHQQGERGQGGGARREGHALDVQRGGRRRRRPPGAEGAATDDRRRRPARARRTSCARQPAGGARQTARPGCARRRGRGVLPVRVDGAGSGLAGRSRDREPVDRPGGAVRDRRRAGRAPDDRGRVRPVGGRHDRQLGAAARRDRRRASTSTSGRRSWSCCCSGWRSDSSTATRSCGRSCRASS